MAWMKRLAETYDLYQDLAGIVKDGQPVLSVTFDYQCPN